MTTVYLIRHAEAEGNVCRRCHGQYDSLLTERAGAQLACLAKRFAEVPLDAIYASDLYRARHTAKAIADTKGMKVHVRQVLREIDMGDWEDCSWAILARQYPERFALWQTRPWECRVPNGETVMECGDRVMAGILQIAQEWDGKSVAVVSHGSAIRAILCRVLGYPPEQIGEIGWGDNTCVAKFEITDGNINPIYWNDAAHLPEALSTFAKIGWTNHRGLPTSAQAWYRPYEPDSQEDRALLLTFARDLYQNAYGSTEMLDEEAWLADTDLMSAKCPRAVTIGMVEEEPVALVRMNVCDESDPAVGMVGSFVLRDDYRGTGMSSQILGQAISVYRSLGKSYLCAHAAKNNVRAQGFYQKYGFENQGEIEKPEGIHYKMVKKIKVETLEEEKDDFIIED